MWEEICAVLDNVVLQVHNDDIWRWPLIVDKTYIVKRVDQMLTAARVVVCVPSKKIVLKGWH